MNYFKLMDELFDVCLSQVDGQGMWYLSPHWRKLVCEINTSNETSFMERLRDENISFNELEDILKLEVERRNACIDRKIEVRSWLYGLLTETVEPEIMEEETKYIKNVIEYMKLNDSLNDKEKELEARVNAFNSKEKLTSLVPNGMTFKKGIG